MEKKTLIAMLALVALGLGAFAVLRTPQKGERVGPAPRPIPIIKASEVAQIEITDQKQDHTTLTRKGDAWRVTSPGDFPADSSGVKSLLDGVEKLSFGDPVTEGKAKHAELGVEEGKCQRLTLKDAQGKVLADLDIGKPIGGFTMVRAAGKDEVWQASGLYAYMTNRDSNSWRNHDVFSFKAADADKLTIESGGSKLVLERDKSSKTTPSWKIAESSGEAPKSTADLDQAQVTGALSAMASLHAADFADGKKPAETGVEAPALTLTAMAGGKAHTLYLGATKGEDTYAKSNEGDTVYVLKKYALDRLAQPPIDYRQKSLVKAAEDELSSIEIKDGGETAKLEHAGDTWKMNGEILDSTKVKPLVSTFADLTASGLSTERAPAKTNLGHPSGEVTLKLKSGPPVVLKVGALTPDKTEYYVEKVGAPELFLVKKYVVTRFLKKPAELSSKAPGAAVARAGKRHPSRPHH